MTQDPPQRLPRTAVAALVLALGSALALVAAPLGYRLDLWGYPVALLRITAFATGGAGLGALLSLVALALCWRADGRRGVKVAAAAAVIGGATFGFMLTQVLAARSLPQIHDITTDTADPPAFVAVVPLREAAGANPHAYGGPELAAEQRRAYPNLAPFASPLEPPAAFDRALAAARSLGWTIVEADRARLRFEANDTTLWYGFTDDVVVRVSAQGGGSRVDVRSLSRVGRSDVGKNAARIRAFLAALDGG